MSRRYNGDSKKKKNQWLPGKKGGEDEQVEHREFLGQQNYSV
jgi:hypothetical protein